MMQQMIAEFDHQLPVLARIGVGNGGDLLVLHGMARIGQQRAMQGALDHARCGRRRELRPRQIGLEEFVGHRQPATRVAIEQVMAAGEPKIFHPSTPANALLMRGRPHRQSGAGRGSMACPPATTQIDETSSSPLLPQHNQVHLLCRFIVAFHIHE